MNLNSLVPHLAITTMITLKTYGFSRSYYPIVNGFSDVRCYKFFVIFFLLSDNLKSVYSTWNNHRRQKNTFQSLNGLFNCSVLCVWGLLKSCITTIITRSISIFLNFIRRSTKILFYSLSLFLFPSLLRSLNYFSKHGLKIFCWLITLSSLNVQNGFASNGCGEDELIYMSQRKI